MNQKEFLILIDQIINEFTSENYYKVLEKYYEQLRSVLHAPIDVHHLMESLYSFKMNKDYNRIEP